MITSTREPAVTAPRPQPGSGTRMTANALGVAVDAPRRGGAYRHPFQPSLGGNRISFSRGLVETFEPKIGGEKISGEDGITRPFLVLDEAVANAAGESWVCIEVTKINAQGLIDKESKLAMVHTSQPTSLERERALCPVCLILWPQGVPVIGVEDLTANVRYERVERRVGPPRHYFF